MLSINIICIGKIKENYLKSAIDEYSKRLSKYCKLNIIELPDEKIPDKLNEKISFDIKNKECQKILSTLKKDTFTISLDLNRKRIHLQKPVAAIPLAHFLKKVRKILCVSLVKIHAQRNSDALFQQQPHISKHPPVRIILHAHI